jgi:2-hydroxychromene-2-carboxylate isomerase
MRGVMLDIDFYFDVVSPYAWLGWHALARLRAQTGIEVRCTPVLFAALLDAHGSIGPAEIPAKRAHTIRDVMRTAKLEGLPFRFPPAHPFNPLQALRLCVAIEDDADCFRLAGALLDAVWCHGQDITREDTLLQTLSQCGLPAAALGAARSKNVKTRLRDNTQAALAHGVFGVPTCRVGSELFWGHDRVVHLAAWLRGDLGLDEQAYAAALAAPRGSDRKRPSGAG